LDTEIVEMIEKIFRKILSPGFWEWWILGFSWGGGRRLRQHLAALRMLFDWLVAGHVLDVDPALPVSRNPLFDQ